MIMVRRSRSPSSSEPATSARSGSESGWGVNLAHQGDIIFATWFTYDVAGKAWWLSMSASPRHSLSASSRTLPMESP